METASEIPIIGKKSRPLTVRGHISGGVAVGFGDDNIVLSPKDAVEFATAVLKAVGVDVKLDGSMFPQ